ncbi:flagellar motor protein MotB [Burkholderiaceae bacterium]
MAEETQKPEDATAAPAEAEAKPAAPAPEDAEPVAAAAAEHECPKCEECPPCVKGAPAWMATFADMATLLMAFFVLLLSFAEMNVPKFKQINGSLKNSFGVQRLIPVVESPKATSLIAKHFSPAMAEPTPVNTIRQQTTDDRKENVELKIDVSPAAAEALEKAKQQLAQEINRGEVQVKVENDKVVVEMVAPLTGGASGPDGQQKGGNSSSGSQQGGSSASGAQQAGGGASGSQQAGASKAGNASGGSASSGAKQAGTVPQGEIEFFAKVADLQASSQAPVEVRDNRTGGASGKGNSGSAGGPANADAELQRIREALAKEIQSGKAEVERDGARVIIRLAEQGSFRSGSADLQPAFTQLLDQVGKTIAQSNGRIYIEGHTDNVPVVFNERFKSNWDLSGARAGAVADRISGVSGIAPGRMSVSGYADTRPLDNNSTAAGRGRNRRIEIIVDGAS